ncbi:MAG: phosphoribosyltransferase family protein [Infirmifilum sp.]
MYSKRIEEATTQVICHKALKAVRAHIPPKEILEELNRAGIDVSPVDLSRYLGGLVLPAPDKALQILEAIYKTGLAERVLRVRVHVDSHGVVNVPDIAFDTRILELASAVAFLLFRGRVDLVVTAATNGIPLASTIASFLGARLAVARRERESPSIKYITTGLFLRDPPSYVHLYLPADSIRRGDRVLIADDLFSTGRTLKAMLNMVEEARGNPIGGFALIAMGNAWREVAPSGLEIVTLLNV